MSNSSRLQQRLICCFAIVFSAATASRSALGQHPAPGPPQPPRIAAASDEGQAAIAGFKQPADVACTLFAAEPQVANPVAFCIDAQGRFYVCESFRQGRGVTDNRKHNQQWLDADLAARTVEDRYQYHQRLLGRKIDEYTKYDDRIRLLEDRDGDGRADQATVFASGFNAVVDGSGAGVLARGKDVYFTCIPHLWKLQDNDGDGQSDQRRSLHYGYGVRVAFRGHDLHGLIRGPDGRLYFSIGDRGYHIESAGKVLSDPASGAVFRCELDGSNLEVYARGLRNPQELAFDDWGNLFTGDNNSDSGDRARWVYVVPGGDSGWRMYYQYLSDRGPFNREKIWHPYDPAVTPAYTVPCVTNLADGPSGLAFYPGTGLGDHFRDRFLLCDFRGGPANSGIRTFRVQPRGASFEVVDQEQTFWRILATDLAFGPDGALYVSDWVNGWEGEGKGRIYRFAAKQPDPRAATVKLRLAADPTKQSSEGLVQWLSDPDQRVRLEAQWELARRGQPEPLLTVAQTSASKKSRVHGVWGLSQLLRGPKPASADRAWTALLKLAADPEEEVRAQACRALAEGHGRFPSPTQLLQSRIADASPRVASFAALSAGALGDAGCQSALLSLLSANADADPMIRHAGIMGLRGTMSADELAALNAHPDRSVRIAATVALRKLASPQVAGYLNDADPQVILEAARAIHDGPLAADPAALAALAERIDALSDDDPLTRRVLNANYRIGTPTTAARLAAFAARPQALPERRLEAIEMLWQWDSPSSRDRVLGIWRPLDERDATHRQAAAEALRGQLANLLSGSDALRDAALRAAAALGIKEVAPQLAAIVAATEQPGARRAAALRALQSLGNPELPQLVERCLVSQAPELRAAARRALLAAEPVRGWQELQAAAAADTLIERQDALAVAAEKGGSQAAEIARQQMERTLQGDTPADTLLDVLHAASSLKGPSQPLLKEFRQRQAGLPTLPERRSELLQGGSVGRGRQIFYERTAVSCVRCHKVADRGGEVGPNLTLIGKEKPPAYLLESILDPNAAVARGFDSIQVLTEDGVRVSGILKQETEDALQLMTPEGRLVTISTDDIAARRKGKSAMPEDLAKQLSDFELRDLIAFLTSLREPAQAAPTP